MSEYFLKNKKKDYKNQNDYGRIRKNSENFKYLLKAAGIVLVSQCLQELCRDAGQGALAYAADLAGRYLVLLTALPMMQRALDVLLELLQ